MHDAGEEIMKKYPIVFAVSDREMDNFISLVTDGGKVITREGKTVIASARISIIICSRPAHLSTSDYDWIDDWK
jgi:hypothetical protein